MNKYHFDNSIVNGKPAHAHYLNGKKLLGTSTVVGVIDKSGPMKYWAVGKACEHLGWTHPKENGRYVPMDERITDEFMKHYTHVRNLFPHEYMALLDGAYNAHAVNLDNAADKGTELHKALENYILQCVDDYGGEPVLVSEKESPPVRLFANWAYTNVSRFIASEAHCYSERLMTGGIVDVIYEDTAGELVILDFKSSKAAYSTHYYQAAGYALAIEENGIFTADGELIRTFDKSFAYYLTLPFGMANPSPQIGTAEDKELGKNTAKCKRAFELCAELWGIVNGG